MDGAQLRTLQKALEIVVTKERLGAALNVPVNEVEAYLAGVKPVPLNVFLAALDVVAKTPP